MKYIWIAVIVMIVMIGRSAVAQGVPSAMPLMALTPPAAPELNREALKATPQNDIQARIKIMQEAIDRATAFSRARSFKLPSLASPRVTEPDSQP